MSKETAYSIMFTLLQRHEDAVDRYRQLQGMVSREDLAEWVGDLADHREEMAGTVRSFLENSAPIPVRNKSRDATRSYLHKHWEKAEEAAARDNWLEIIRLCRETEESISRYYQNSMGSEGIADGIRDLLEQHHKKILQVNRKAERLEKVPQRK